MIRTLGGDPDQLFLRLPLQMVYPVRLRWHVADCTEITCPAAHGNCWKAAV
jgi:hypothetical protein